MTSEQRIIYITGRGGDASKGLGAYLKTIDPHRIGLSVKHFFGIAVRATNIDHSRFVTQV